MEGGFFMNKNEQVEYEVLRDFQDGKKSSIFEIFFEVVFRV